MLLFCSENISQFPITSCSHEKTYLTSFPFYCAVNYSVKARWGLGTRWGAEYELISFRNYNNSALWKQLSSTNYMYSGQTLLSLGITCCLATNPHASLSPNSNFCYSHSMFGCYKQQTTSLDIQSRPRHDTLCQTWLSYPPRIRM